MSFFFDYDDGIKLEVTDDGALVFLNYDIEHDVVLAELGEEVSHPVRLLEDWEERPIPTLFLLQGQYAGATYGEALYAAIAKKWILDTASFLGKNKCISRDFEKSAIKYIKDGDFEDRFETVFVKAHGYPFNQKKKVRKVWSAALSDAINKYASTIKSGLDYKYDVYTIKFDIERALSFYDSPKMSWEKKKGQFRHKMLLTVIQTMGEHR